MGSRSWCPWRIFWSLKLALKAHPPVLVLVVRWIRSSLAGRRHAQPPVHALLPPSSLSGSPPRLPDLAVRPASLLGCVGDGPDHGSVSPCRPLASESAHWPRTAPVTAEKTGLLRSAAMAIRHYWPMAAAAVGFRLVLVLFGGDLHLSSRPEVSTPLTSLRRRKQLLARIPSSPANPSPPCDVAVIGPLCMLQWQKDTG
jgi:hypothetical protein